MSSIKILKQTVQKDLAASCVIDSPVSVVKELIDNSIDAKANSITIEVDQKTCGLEWICVKDDGFGIPKESTPFVCLNHATSKITSDLDINHVTTLGFRGQALHHITGLCDGDIHFCARAASDLMGTSWDVDENGSIVEASKKNISMNRGTTVCIKGLFKRFPVRHKILGKVASKHHKALDKLVKEYALIHNEIRMELKRVNPSAGSNNQQRARVIYLPSDSLSFMIRNNAPLPDRFVFVKPESSEIIDGVSVFLILPASTHFSTFPIAINDEKGHDKSMIKLISVNDRLMNSQRGFGKILSKTIQEVYTDLYSTPLYSFYLKVTISFTHHTIDPNIEPLKDDVVIGDSNKVLESIKSCIMKTLNMYKGQNPALVEFNQRDTFLEPQNCETEVPRYKSDMSQLANSESGEDSSEKPNQNDWCTSMHDCLSSSQGLSDNDILRISDPYCGEDEDIMLAKDVTLSNPFVLSKMAQSSKSQREIDMTNNSNSSIRKDSNTGETHYTHVESKQDVRSKPRIFQLPTPISTPVKANSTFNKMGRKINSTSRTSGSKLNERFGYNSVSKGNHKKTVSHHDKDGSRPRDVTVLKNSSKQELNILSLLNTPKLSLPENKRNQTKVTTQKLEVEKLFTPSSLTNVRENNNVELNGLHYQVRLGKFSNLSLKDEETQEFNVPNKFVGKMESYAGFLSRNILSFCIEKSGSDHDTLTIQRISSGWFRASC